MSDEGGIADFKPQVISVGAMLPDGTEIPQVGISGHLAGAIADLVSLERDVSFAADCALTYANNSLPVNQPKTDEQSFFCQAVWSAGAISYRRAFMSGRGHLVNQGSRMKINDKWKDILEPELLAAHERVMENANQHIAHRVGDEEGVRVIALLNPPPGPRGVAGIGHFIVHSVGPDPIVAQRLVEVCKVLRQLINDERSRLENLLLERLGQGDLDALYAASAEDAQPEVTEPPSASS